MDGNGSLLLDPLLVGLGWIIGESTAVGRLYLLFPEAGGRLSEARGKCGYDSSA